MRARIRTSIVMLFAMAALLGMGTAPAIADNGSDGNGGGNSVIGIPIGVCEGGTTNIANPGAGGSISDCYLEKK
jgi:hypothetical protein